MHCTLCVQGRRCTFLPKSELEFFTKSIVDQLNTFQPDTTTTTGQPSKVAVQILAIGREKMKFRKTRKLCAIFIDGISKSRTWPSRCRKRLKKFKQPFWACVQVTLPKEPNPVWIQEHEVNFNAAKIEVTLAAICDCKHFSSLNILNMKIDCSFENFEGVPAGRTQLLN